MLTHKDIWQAIDDLAKEHGLSPSGLAKKAGLDPTTFNKSKRENKNGRPRWPSTESISRILKATDSHFSAFVSDKESAKGRKSAVIIPLIGMAQAGKDGYFDDGGHPTGFGGDVIDFPDIKDSNAYALQISGDSMLPLYRDGDIVVISPASNVRTGDRIVLKTKRGEIMAKELRRKTNQTIHLKSLNQTYDDVTIPTHQVEWLARIIWASQ
ncbi:MAG: helix-turn-helix transcriptional regulator [Alphaproteobacteria bacterium GM202ARS2]|nr:helix-turn-helix transcriptional regulator [Alphaproteobacteria bacterium GM202ARS2]